MSGMAGMAPCKRLTLAKEAFSCYSQILSLSFSSKSAVVNDFYMDIHCYVYVAVVDHDIDGLHVPCLQKFFKNMKSFSSLYSNSKDPFDHTDTPDRDSARNVTVFCLLV